MTLPYEEKRSLFLAQDFLRDLLNPKKTPKVPKLIREKAYWVLRHFPYGFEIDLMFDLREKQEREALKDKVHTDIRFGK